MSNLSVTSSVRPQTTASNKLSKYQAVQILVTGNNDNNNKLQAFQLIVLARYLLGVPEP